MNEVQANGGIDDINARYNTKMEGYKIWMSYMKELGEMIPQGDMSCATLYQASSTCSACIQSLTVGNIAHVFPSGGCNGV